MKFSRRLVLQSSPALLGALSARRALAEGPAPKTYVIELCMRDQVDFGHIMVAPSLARDSTLRRGENGRRAALFFDQNALIEARPNMFLTPQSAVLRPHLDSIAMVELGELTFGPTHGHEAGNPLRSPGRSLQSSGKIAMWNGEPGTSNGEGATYSTTPTIVALHNAWQKQSHPGTRNGVVLKGTQRMHAIYHFGANIAGAEPDRFQTVDALLRAFPPATQDLNIIKSSAEAEALQAAMLQRDRRFLARRGIRALNHETQVADSKRLLHRDTASLFSLALTDQERAEWSAGVPAKYGRTTINVWEQAAYAFKLIAADVVRSVAMEVDIGDVHGERTAAQMRDQTLLMVLPLARLIEKLKAVGLYERTLLIISTADGGRAPASGSSGDEGKNGFVLAGGMVRGGYYGDIRNAGPDGDGQRYRYHMPDVATGQPIADGTTGNDRRLPAAPLWRTMAKALQIPDALASQFPDVTSARPMPWLITNV
jgi:hypothetical protein